MTIDNFSVTVLSENFVEGFKPFDVNVDAITAIDHNDNNLKSYFEAKICKEMPGIRHMAPEPLDISFDQLDTQSGGLCDTGCVFFLDGRNPTQMHGIDIQEFVNFNITGIDTNVIQNGYIQSIPNDNGQNIKDFLQKTDFCSDADSEIAYTILPQMFQIAPDTAIDGRYQCVINSVDDDTQNDNNAKNYDDTINDTISMITTGSVTVGTEYISAPEVREVSFGRLSFETSKSYAVEDMTLNVVHIDNQNDNTSFSDLTLFIT